MMISLFITT